MSWSLNCSRVIE